MATAYKTPGVYIEEIPKFPPSIAAVETAIPAFIGYTEMAQKNKPGDLLNIPTKIGSIAEYEAFFGDGYSPSVTGVVLDDKNNFKSATIANSFYTYDSLRLFYANGGGDCYIVSVGTYDAAGKTKGDFTDPDKGLNTLEKVDEPTILVFPDNSLLSSSDFYSVYQAALAQCSSLQDRLGLFHTVESDPMGDTFRSSLGINDLKYGTAYSPWLEVNMPKAVDYRSFKDVIFKGASNYKLGSLTTDANIQKLISDYEQVIKDVDAVRDASSALGSPTLRDKFTALESAYQGANVNDAAAKLSKFTALMNYLYDAARKVDQLIGASGVGYADLKSSLQSLISSTLLGIYSTLIGYEKELAEKVAGYTTQFTVGSPTANDWKTKSKKTIFDPANNDIAASSVLDPAADTDVKKMASFIPLMEALFDQINSAWLGGVAAAAQTLEGQKHDGLMGSFPLYKSIVSGIQNSSSSVPPSGAVAGIYAYVDRTRGVWKAPANVSLSGVIGPKVSFKASELDALNVDPNSGKSINAIRFFTGKGTLVFGARTLAGNDNEWRYVSVRRFFIFAEESIKKATEQFVFEPNDANTWVKIQAMIENFLTTLWRQGALQGVKPEHAFYVAVGLGKTMTPLDILEGRLIIEIGMAVVRPAEFIILRFSHKMAES